MSINEKIEELRIENGITKKHLADYFGKSITWYSSIAKGEIKIKAEDLSAFAMLLKVDVIYFFEN